MAVITFEIDTSVNIPNIVVEKRYSNGVHNGYRLTPVEGYVLHDHESCDTVTDFETGETTVYHYYYRAAYMALNNPPEAWTIEAVPEADVPADSIFGGGNNNTEVM
jgi:hypothetical protein